MSLDFRHILIVKIPNFLLDFSGKSKDLKAS